MFVPFNFIDLNGNKCILYSDQQRFDLHAELKSEDEENIVFKNCSIMRSGRYFKLSEIGCKSVTKSVTFAADNSDFSLEELISMDLNLGKKVILSDLIVDGNYNKEISPVVIF